MVSPGNSCLAELFKSLLDNPEEIFEKVNIAITYLFPRTPLPYSRDLDYLLISSEERSPTLLYLPNSLSNLRSP